ncbi:hypothetical protein B0H12DRAFT_1245901 [Mycena haematopus]|nr:hypothetical protein B0H12DRAFT_1245901 [Mycena haematopus]
MELETLSRHVIVRKRSHLVHTAFLFTHPVNPSPSHNEESRSTILTPHPSPPLSDSSSDSPLRPIVSIMSDFTTVTAPTGKLPMLSAGEVTPAVVAEFEFTCKNYFNTKSTEEPKRVATILQ